MADDGYRTIALTTLMHYAMQCVSIPQICQLDMEVPVTLEGADNGCRIMVIVMLVNGMITSCSA